MLELLVCSMVTILPDYLYRRYVQGKRFGREINLYTVWYELRWGITLCLVLTISLITMIFYFHPATTNVASLFRTVTILPEKGGRVADVFVKLNDQVEAGQPLFQLDSTAEKAALETARRQVTEDDAALAVANTELVAADGQIQAAQSSYQQAVDEYETKNELILRNASTVAEREVQKLQVAVEGRKGTLDAVLANKKTLEEKISSLLPAQKASAEAAVQQAQVDLDKTLVRAGIKGTVAQFTLRPGDVVNPMVRPAGLLIPANAGHVMVAGFGQIEAQIMKVGMLGEIACSAKPFTIIPVVVTQVQDVIAAGQVRPTDLLVDVQQVATPGTITVFMESLYPGQLDDIPPGSSCTANAYTSFEERLATEKLDTPTFIFMHVVDTVAMVHAMILRLQALMLPVQTLVLSGGH
jgi:multidrug resistance efflux pump